LAIPQSEGELPVLTDKAEIDQKISKKINLKKNSK